MTTKEIIKRLSEIEEQMADIREQYMALRDEAVELSEKLNSYDDEAENDRLDRWEEERRASKYDEE